MTKAGLLSICPLVGPVIIRDQRWLRLVLKAVLMLKMFPIRPNFSDSMSLTKGTAAVPRDILLRDGRPFSADFLATESMKI
jgi:hypothetical protein